MEFYKTVLWLIMLIWVQAVNAFETKFVEGLWIYGKDGTKLSANVHMPIDQTNKKPLIIFANSWNLDEYEYYFPAKKLAKKGYIVLSYSARGWGKSEGLVAVASQNDLDDVDAVIDWATQSLPCDPDKIGMAGISYGGGLSLLAATHNPKIKAVAIMSAWADLETALYGNQTPANLWGNLLVSTGKLLGHLDPVVEEKFQALLKHTDIDDTIQWSKRRSPLTYIDQLNEYQTAVYISQNLGDRLFTPNRMLTFFQQLKVPKRIDINRGIHASAEASGLFGRDNYVWNQVNQWFDHWLMGADNNIERPPLVNIELKKGRRVQRTNWPVQQDLVTYYLHKRPYSFYPGQLSSDLPVQPMQDQISFGRFSGVHSGLPIVAPILEAHQNIPIMTWLPGINFTHAIYYQTQPFPQARTIVGIPHISLWFRATQPQSQLVVYLYDVDRFGIAQLISHAPITRYQAKPNSYQLSEFELAMTAHTVDKGHRLALAISTFDLLYASPKTNKYIMQIAYGSNLLSRIDIPYLL